MSSRIPFMTDWKRSASSVAVSVPRESISQHNCDSFKRWINSSRLKVGQRLWSLVLYSTPGRETVTDQWISMWSESPTSLTVTSFGTTTSGAITASSNLPRAWVGSLTSCSRLNVLATALASDYRCLKLVPSECSNLRLSMSGCLKQQVFQSRKIALWRIVLKHDVNLDDRLRR